MSNVRSRRTLSLRLLTLSAVVVTAATALTGAGAASAAGPSPVARQVFFHSPTGNIQCELDRRADGSTTAYCQTFRTPKSVALSASGRVLHVCQGVACLGNGPRTSRTLAYGQSVRLGAVTCTSRRTGVTCVSHHHGFVINRAGIRTA